MKNDSLGERIKNNYEFRARTYLTRRTPVIIRLDGKAFHTFTRGLEKPFDEGMTKAMKKTCLELIDNIQGAKLVYSQSDEISVLITDYEKLNTDAWFDYNVQKMVSIAASIASVVFNSFWLSSGNHLNKAGTAFFDARAFNIPKEEVNNYFVWRQQDATRNAINGLGQKYFSHKELHKKNTSQIQDMLMEKGVNFNDVPTQYKRGFCVTKDGIDVEIPIFTQDHEYVEKYVI